LVDEPPIAPELPEFIGVVPPLGFVVPPAFVPPEYPLLPVPLLPLLPDWAMPVDAAVALSASAPMSESTEVRFIHILPEILRRRVAVCVGAAAAAREERVHHVQRPAEHFFPLDMLKIAGLCESAIRAAD
jgi:hypothetical protein